MTKVIHTAKIMGWFGAAVKNDTQVWDFLSERLNNLFYTFWTGSRQSTAREKDRITTIGQVIQGNCLRGTPFLIVGEWSMFFEGANILRNRLLPKGGKIALPDRYPGGRLLYTGGRGCRKKS